MKKLALLLCFVILASSVFAADVKYTFIDASCDEEGRGIFYFIIEFEEAFTSSEARIEGIPGDWYNCVEANCVYDFYQTPLGADPKETISSGKGYQLVTPPLIFNDSKTYKLEFTYPTEVEHGKGEDYDTIDISLQCPGYDFSCSLYDFELYKCESDGNKFMMYMTAKGINQPHRISLINDFRYGLVGEKAQIVDDQPLTEASIKYKEMVPIALDKTQVISLGNDKYSIEFPYQDTARWLSVKGRYCRHDNSRFGRSNFEFLATKRCTVKEFIVEAVSDEPEPEEPPKTTKFYPVPPQETKAAEPVEEEEPEEDVPREEITIITFFRMLFDFFKR